MDDLRHGSGQGADRKPGTRRRTSASASPGVRPAPHNYASLAANLAVIPTTSADDDTYGSRRFIAAGLDVVRVVRV
jgi:hypothetical protein